MLKIQNQNDQVNINKQKTNSNAIILAAGQGIRMIPINNSVPKALLEVNGEILIERIIEQLIESDVHDITIVVGFMEDQFHYLIDKYGVKLVSNAEYKEKNNLHSLNLVRNLINNTYLISGNVYFYENPFACSETKSWYMFENRLSKHSNMICNDKNEVIKTTRHGLKTVGVAYINSQDAILLKEQLKVLDNSEHDSDDWEEALFLNNKMLVEGKIVDTSCVDEINTYEELRSIDDHSSHLNNDTLSLIADVFNEEVKNITHIKSLKKGMTNRSFLFEINKEKYIMRIPGEGTSQLINRTEEYEVYQKIKNFLNTHKPQVNEN